MQTSTRARMVAAGLALLRRRGYAETSWRTLVEESGTPFGSIQHFFPRGKTQLVEEALELFVAQLISWFRQAHTDHGRPSQVVEGWIAKIADHFEIDSFAAGCPIAAVSLDAVPRDEALSLTCSKSFSSLLNTLSSGLQSLGLKDSDTWAVRILSSVEGSLILGRVQKSASPLRDAGQWIATQLSSMEE